MNWDDVIDRLTAADLQPHEEIYIEQYGKVLVSQRPEFAGRYFRCTYGEVLCGKIRVEIFLFPSDFHLQEFLEIIGDNPWYFTTGNAVLHFPDCDPAPIDNIVSAITPAPR